MVAKNVKNLNIMTETTNILTLDNLTRAIQNSMGVKGIDKPEAKRMAEHMLNFFGYSDRIIDNVLEPEDRDVFYMMEDSGLLTTEREETTLYDGREWRINYWLFKKGRIQELMNLSSDDEEEGENEDNVYEDIPEDVWNRDES
jgi:hypothetical protein